MLETILRFLHPLDNLPIFFTNGDTFGDPAPLIEAQRVMEKIFYESLEDDMMSEIKIYPVSELFFALHRVIIENKNRRNGTEERSFPSLVSASNKFYTIGNDHSIVGCDFHNSQDVNQHCCLSKVLRFAVRFSNWCTDGKQAR
jgi:piRNA pathway germ-plasm component